MVKFAFSALFLVLLPAGSALFAQVVESPTTVARGAWLVESDLVAGVWDRTTIRGENQRAREIIVAPVLVSTGVTDHVDVQVGFDGWSESRHTVDGQTERVAGWGDVWVRSKWNFWGEEETGPALAVLPYVKLPVADRMIGNGEVEGGVALLYGQPLGEVTWLAASVSGDSLHSEVRGRAEQFVAGVVVGKALAARTSLYAEVVVEWLAAADSAVPVLGGFGLTRSVAPGLTLDFEVMVGLTGEAADWVAAVRWVWVPGSGSTDW